MEKVLNYFEKNDKFAKHNGIELLEVGPGHAIAKMEIKDYHKNSVGVVHGGAIFTLADYVFAAACNSYGRIAVAINVSVNFIKAGLEGSLTAEGIEVSKGHKLATYDINIKDDSGEIISTFRGLCYRKKDEIDFGE